MTAFAELGMMPEITSAVEEMDWLLPTDIQQEAIPLILGGGDVLMAAETGSGKTGAFCLPVLQIVFEAHRGRAAAAAAPKPAPGLRPCVMNAYDREPAFAISADGLLCQSRDEHVWQGGRGTVAVTKGKHFYEVTMTDEGLCRCGWSTVAASLNLGTDRQGFGFGGTGKKSHARQFDSYGEPYGLGDVLGCYIDLDNHVVSYTKNGADLGVAFEIPKALHGQGFYPAANVKNAELMFNFGDAPFKHPPAGPHAAFAGVSRAKESERAASDVAAAKGGRTPCAVILEPARELAEQTHAQLELFRKNLPEPGVRCVLLIGGGDTKKQLDTLKAGADIVVGTPGRVADFLKTGKLNVSQVRFYVLDEADGLLTGGHGGMVNELFDRLPKQTEGGARLQMVVCSATLHHPEVKKMADRLMYHPTWVDLKGQDAVPDTVHHVVCVVDPVKDARWRERSSRVGRTDGVHAHAHDAKQQAQGNSPECMSEAVKILKYLYVKAAVDELKMDQAIIFCRTKYDCDNMEAFLNKCGGGACEMVNAYSCAVLHGDRKPHERRGNLQAFKDGEVRFLICTDVAARGIDVRGVPYCINVTLPDEKEQYVHRIGRVGRAERMGLAVSLVGARNEKVWYCHQGCPSKGKLPCSDTRLKEKGGCTIWQDELEYLRNVEEHLGVTVPVVGPDMKVPTCEFDGHVVYGEKRSGSGSEYVGHAEQLAPSVAELARLEATAQTSFLEIGVGGFR